jgi:hypothetical protein
VRPVPFIVLCRDDRKVMTANCTGRYTADAGIGAISDDESGGATHNDPPANGADEVVAAMLRDPFTRSDEFMLLNGDISYARGFPWIWERYFDQVQPLATSMPWMVGMGNHEVDTNENASNRRGFPTAEASAACLL